ncbi:ABSCISIC ACID-INSENSITIVE 5-like protein 2 [Benincasa hispida]|uniref:ABSCISIC ACID-INSENSITIVE 5-like protein 2 n=1 Tax=Benincasa hispida TaxID=102211 RepID=UPI0019005560|nr:ABSCISIC ACID-INSENSITIVE 5-like protein 2 [Benincasa hispida]
MNLDELVLRNVMSVEEAELVHNPSSSSPAASTASLFLGKRNEDVEPRPDPMAEVSASAEGMDWMHYQRALLIDSKLPVSQAVYNHASVPDFGVYNMQAMSITTSASLNSDFQEGNCGRKRRQLDDIKEKTIERRQRRMIKNRESAARSRARKQAYTNQLEHEVLCLRKTNSWLRKQEEAERLFSSNPIPMPRYQLRRTSSAFF